MRKNRKATIQDIAKHAGVSTGTVDRVIHNRGKVIEEKKKKIEDAIKQLNFNPNLLARTLALKKQFVISSLMPKPINLSGFWALPKKGIEQSFLNYVDYGMIHDPHEYSLFDEASFSDKAQLILDGNPNGVILAPKFEKESRLFVKKLDERNIPFVFIDVNIEIKNCLSYIGPNLKRSGAVAGKLCSSALLNDDDILIVNSGNKTDGNTNMNDIEIGFRKYFNNQSKSHNRNIYTLNMNFRNEATVQSQLQDFYNSYPNVKVVFVTNSRAHIISKFHNRNSLEKKVIGFDMVKENILEVKKGNIDYLISQRPISQGIKSVQALMEFFLYKKIPLAVQQAPLDIIIKENIDFYINWFKINP